MKIIFLTLIALIIIPINLYAQSFEGAWEIFKVNENKVFPWHDEIKYPKKFNLIKKENGWEGSYTDQYDFKCKFSLVVDINDGNELILVHCGTTKHPEAWSPIHKIKIENGKIIGLTITDKLLFSWEAIRTENR